MDEEKVKLQIGGNIAAYRKKAGLTQAGLAEKLNYSDKAISKWERGESVPDVLTMMQLAQLFGVNVNVLLEDPDALPDNPGMIQRAMSQVSEKALKRKADKNIILALSSTLVWFVALLVFVVLTTLSIPYGWMAFIYALPVNAIVLLSLRSAWRDFRRNPLLISCIVWGCLLSIYLSLLVYCKFHAELVFLLGIPGQIAILLWFRMFRPVKPSQEENHE